MKRPYQITGAVFLVFAIFIGWEAQTLKFYTSLGPGPGFFPFWLAVIFGVLALFMLYHATFGTSDPMPLEFFASRIGYLRALAVIASMVWATVMLEKIGFRLTMLVFFLWLLLTLGRVNYLLTAAIAVVGSWGTFYVFDTWLKVPLPQGTFGF